MKAKKVRVLVVDDQEIVRIAYKAAIAADDRTTLAGLTDDVEDAKAAIVKRPPDVVLTEILLSRLDGLDLVRWIARNHDTTLPIIVSAVAHPALVRDGRLAGAAAYIDKRTPVHEIIDTVVEVFRAGRFDWSAMTGFDRVVPPEDAARLETLTARERDVLVGIGQGKINREIARDYNLTEKTVKNYVSHILQKLDMQCRAEVAALAGRLDFAEHPPIPAKEWSDRVEATTSN